MQINNQVQGVQIVLLELLPLALAQTLALDVGLGPTLPQQERPVVSNVQQERLPISKTVQDVQIVQLELLPLDLDPHHVILVQ